MRTLVPGLSSRIASGGRRALAAQLGAPVIVHDREAHEDVLQVLREYRPRA